jgi:hypothetical protein
MHGFTLIHLFSPFLFPIISLLMVAGVSTGSVTGCSCVASIAAKLLKEAVVVLYDVGMSLV